MRFYNYCKKFQDKIVIIYCFKSERSIKGVVKKINPYSLTIQKGRYYLNIPLNNVALIKNYYEVLKR